MANTANLLWTIAINVTCFVGFYVIGATSLLGVLKTIRYGFAKLQHTLRGSRVATPENTFIASVHRHLPVKLYRMKNHNQFNGGIADCWYSGPAGDLWVEYKFIVIPKRDDTVIKIELSELQKNWLTSRHHEGRRVAVVVGSKEGGVWFGGVDWKIARAAKDFRDMVMSRNALATRITATVC